MEPRLDLSGFVHDKPDGSKRLDLVVDGITCWACVGEIEEAVRKAADVTLARVNYTTHRLGLEWVRPDLDPAIIVDRLKAIGYAAEPFDSAQAETEEARTSRMLLRCLAVAGFAAMNIMLLSVSVWSGNVSGIDAPTRDLFHWISALIALPAAAFSGQVFFRSAWRALKIRSLNMDVPISLGICLALLMSVIETAGHAEHAYYDSAIMLIFFLLLGRFFDNAMRRKTREVAANLASLRPRVACRLSADDLPVVVPLSVVAPGDRVLVRAGERIPVDGIALQGASDVDESLLTGETRLRAVAVGARVHAATLNMSGPLVLRVEAASGATMFDEIERLLETASAAKSRFVRLADRVSRIYAPVVHLTAFLTFLAWMSVGAGLHTSIIIAIAVLIVTCPCALALAVPAVQVVAGGAMFRAGILLNRSDAIERLGDVDTIVFDKTGTLTLPTGRLADTSSIAPDLLDLARQLARSSHHPLARALSETGGGASQLEAREIPGQGVEAQIDGVPARLGSPVFCDAVAQATAFHEREPDASLIVVRHGDRMAIIPVRQRLREDAAATIAALRARGVRMQILSGDHAAAVAEVAQALGISEHASVLRPAEKVARVAALQASGARVLMVGDGMNDAPALAAAHVSLSPISGADITQAAADATFLGERLWPVVVALDVARQSRRLMRENLAFAILYNVCAVPLAMSGHLTPLIAALAMSGSSLVVTVNAMRAACVASLPRRPAQPDAGRDLDAGVGALAMEAAE